ncbi:hypothetical protein HMPREF1207_03870 [Paenibacillus sp. HGH0039]|nr:hypothetical protein HMPREF1207_03870 [Paenibacillus sp. HGH0039]
MKDNVHVFPRKKRGGRLRSGSTRTRGFPSFLHHFKYGVTAGHAREDPHLLGRMRNGFQRSVEQLADCFHTCGTGGDNLAVAQPFVQQGDIKCSAMDVIVLKPLINLGLSNQIS